MLIDTHAHIMEPHFDEDREAVIRRALDAGVKKMVNVGCTIKSSGQSARMALEYDFLWGTQGLHPSDWQDFSDTLMRQFYEIAKSNKKIVAIGETGLDYHYGNANPEKQQESLRAQMRLAQELGLPIVIHSRQAENDTLKILKEFPKVRCIMHCFAQTREYAEEILPMGHMFSFSGILTYPGAEEIRKVAAMLPADRICVETDCPYLPPQSKRGERNEPSYIVETARKLAEIRGNSFEEIAEITSANAESFFRLF